MSEDRSERVVLLLSGPNLNLLGEREPEVYGTETLDDHVRTARTTAADHGLELEHVQSNHEGELVDAVQRARGRCAAIIVNAAALTAVIGAGPSGAESHRTQRCKMNPTTR